MNIQARIFPPPCLFLLIAFLLGCGSGGGGGTSGTTVDAPVFSPSPGTYATARSVTLSTTTAGATIRYTTDGLDRDLVRVPVTFTLE